MFALKCEHVRFHSLTECPQTETAQTEMSPDRNGPDRIGQTEKLRTRLKKLLRRVLTQLWDKWPKCLSEKKNRPTGC